MPSAAIGRTRFGSCGHSISPKRVVFIRAGLERNIVPTAKEMEDAVADIYLFGTPEQIDLVRKFVGEFAQSQTASMDALLASLRNDLREELALPPLHKNPALLRVHVKKPTPPATS